MKNALLLRSSFLLAVALAGTVVGCKAGDKTAASDPSGKPHSLPGAVTADKNPGAPPAGGSTAPSPTPAPGSAPPGSSQPAPAAPDAPGIPPPGQADAAKAGPPITPSGPPEQVVAKVNGTTITRGELDFAVRNISTNNERQFPPEKHAELRKTVLDELVDQELLYQKAISSTVKVTDAEFSDSMTKLKSGFSDEKAFSEQLAKDGLKQAQLEAMIRHRMVISKYVRSNIVEHIKVLPEDESKFYETNKDKLKHPEQIRASHILRLVKQGATPAEKDAQKAKINEALARAKKGEDFAALAREYSEDGSKAQGGDLGFFGKGAIGPAFDTAAWALKAGEVSGLVESQFGFHIIKLTDHRPEGYVPLTEVKDQIDKQLTNEKIQAELEKLRATLRTGAKVDITL